MIWNLNGSFRGPISSLDVSSLLKSDHIASISNDHLTLSKARQDVLKDVKENIRTLSTFIQNLLGCCCRHCCLLALVWSHPLQLGKRCQLS